MFTRPSRLNGFDRVADGLALGVLAVVALIAACTFRDYGLGWDDYTHSEYGELLRAMYASGFSDQRALSFVNLYMYGGWFDALAALAAKLLPFDLFETRRLVGAAVGIAGLAVTWRLGRRLGGPQAGAIALVLLATCPLYYGHMFMNAKDAPFAVAMALLLLGLVRAYGEYPAPQPTTIALAGLGLGLTLGTRIMGGIAVLFAVPALALLAGAEVRRIGGKAAALRLARFVALLLPGLALAYLVMGLAWPWSVVEPLNPVRAVGYFAHFFEKPWKEMYDGAATTVVAMPRGYVPTLFALKLPEVLLVLGLGGLAGVAVTAARRDVAPQHRAALVLIALAAALPIAVAVVTRPAMYNGIRHFVFVTPPLAALGGLAGAWAIARVALTRRPLVAVAAAGVLGLALAAPVVEAVRLHPFQYTHFNHLAGGIRAADERYMLDYWGLSFKQAAEGLRRTLTERLAEPTDHRRWKVAVCGPSRTAQVELGPEFEATSELKGADFVMVLEEFYCNNVKAPVIVEVAREGVSYARVYDLRQQANSTRVSRAPR